MNKILQVGILALFCSLAALPNSAMGQADTLPSLSGVIAGPFGIPRLVLDEGGNYTEPIEVYKDANREIFIADITSPGWAQWHVQEFKEKGTYMVCMYVYLRHTEGTIKEFVYMDTHSNSAVVQEPLLIPITIDLAKAPASFRAAMNATTKLVTDQLTRYRGTSIQEALQQQRQMVAQMARQSDHPEMPSPPVPPSPNNRPDRSDVSPPVPLNTVEAVFTEEARKAKYQGICLISLTVDEHGNPQNPQIVRGLAMGLNSKALEAASQYKFKPAIDRRTGLPIPFKITIEVNFRLY